MDTNTLEKIDDLLESFSESIGNSLSWVTVTINGSKVTMLSDSLGCLDLYEIADKLDKDNA
jgi:hypothetical protein